MFVKNRLIDENGKIASMGVLCSYVDMQSNSYDGEHVRETTKLCLFFLFFGSSGSIKSKVD